MEKELYDYFQIKLQLIKYNYGLALKINAPEAIHDMRVDLKRMKAYFSLIAYLLNDYELKKLLEPFKAVSRNTGVLRDVQVQKKLMKNLETTMSFSFKPCIIYLLEKEVQEVENFRRFAEGNVLNLMDDSGDTLKRSLSRLSDNNVYQKIEEHYKILLEKLESAYLMSNDDENTLHKVRIRSKALHYTVEIVQQCFHLFEDREDFIEKMKSLHHILGSWHDNVVGISYIHAFAMECDEDRQSIIQQVLDALEREKMSLRDEFRRVFPEIKPAFALY